ncbi:hypothetical protein G7Z98_09495 [Pseudomonas stutzeri]|nr:hypothetical protein [Stutzerimonas stutzeri]
MNSQDRELLELAAKAAGVAGVFVEAHGPDIGQDTAGIGRPGARYGDRLWNPLEDDGDALRLAVSLGLQVYGREIGCSVDDYVFVDEQDCGGDKYAASRRAIVLAAAEIGKTK